MFSREETAVIDFVDYIVETGQLSGADNEFLEEQMVEYFKEIAGVH